MNEAQRAKVHEIYEYYGTEIEREKIYEELGELITAFSKDNLENILDELADVTICLEHIAYMKNITKEELDMVIDYKLNRQLGRMSVNE